MLFTPGRRHGIRSESPRLEPGTESLEAGLSGAGGGHGVGPEPLGHCGCARPDAGVCKAKFVEYNLLHHQNVQHPLQKSPCGLVGTLSARDLEVRGSMFTGSQTYQQSLSESCHKPVATYKVDKSS